MKYLAISVVSLGAGAVLGLTESQAAARAAFITPLPGKKGMYTTIAPVQFKRGEEFFYDGDLPKNLADSVEAPKKAKADKDAAALSAAKAGSTDLSSGPASAQSAA